MHKKLLPLSLVAILALAGSAEAGLNSNAVLSFHIAPVVSKNQCEYPLPDCIEATVSAPLGTYTVYMIAAAFSDSIGLAGVQVGLDYDGASGSGVDIFNWGLCATYSFPQPGWPAANTGNTITWDSINACQTNSGVTSVAWFYMQAYGADRLALIPRPVDGLFKVADCNAAEEDLTNAFPSHLGYADFGGGDGYNPCSLIVPVRESTWGGIKSLFGE